MATGDVLTLSGGEALQGQLVRIRSGVIQFRTTLEGQIMAPADTVESLATDRNLVITMNDESIVFGRIAFESGANQLYPLDSGVARTIQLADVKEAMPIPSPPAKDTPSYKDALEDWKSSVQTGIRWQDGVKDHVDAYLKVETERRLKDHLVEMNLTVERSDPDEFPSFVSGTARVSQESAGGPGLFGAVSAERETFNALDIRTGLTVGLHFRADGTRSEVDWEAGIQGEYARYDRRGLPIAPYSGDGTGDETALNLQLGLRYARILGVNVEFESALHAYPSLTDPGDVRVRSESSLSIPLSHRLQLRFDVTLQYENDPFFDAIDPWNSSVGASLGFQF